MIALAAVAYAPPHFEATRDPVRVAWGSAVMLSTAFGVTEKNPPTTLLLPALTAALLLSTGVLLLRTWRTQPGERLRALGLGLFSWPSWGSRSRSPGGAGRARCRTATPCWPHR